MRNGGLLGAAVFVSALLPGIGPDDRRIDADPTQLPWSAVGRFQVPGVVRCTAVMVAPHWAVTAAHCLGIRLLGHAVPPGGIHILLGYRDGRFTQHLVPDRVVLPPAALAAANQPDMDGQRGLDIALLHVPGPPTPILPPDPAPLPPGTPVTLGGYGQDRAERLSIDPACTVRSYPPDRTGAPTLAHDCDGTSGTSGGALAHRDATGTWRLAGMQVAGRRNAAGGLAVPAETVSRLLAQQQ